MTEIFVSGSPRGGSGAGSLGGAQQLTGGGGVVAEIFRIPSPRTDPIRSRESDTYHTFAHLPPYSLIDNPIWQGTYTNNKFYNKINKCQMV